MIYVSLPKFLWLQMRWRVLLRTLPITWCTALFLVCDICILLNILFSTLEYNTSLYIHIHVYKTDVLHRYRESVCSLCDCSVCLWPYTRVSVLKMVGPSSDVIRIVMRPDVEIPIVTLNTLVPLVTTLTGVSEIEIDTGGFKMCRTCVGPNYWC